MDTSSQENFMRPEPFPSVSTPVCPVHPLTMDSRPRRHTSARSEEDDQQEAFDRISGILSTLLQEANDAIKEEYNDMLPFKAAATAAPATIKSRPLSRLPRPVIVHDRHSSGSTLSSFEPLSPASSVSTLVNDDDDDTTAADDEDDLVSRTKKQHHPAFSPPSALILRKRLSLHHQQLPTTVLFPARRFSAPPRRRDPLAESYKRLDSSMALVDSLSRDLALESKEGTQQQQQQRQQRQQHDPQSALRLTALLILPFLHIPHALVTTIFDSLSTSDPNNIAGVIAWGLFFALANVMVNRVIRPRTPTTTTPTPPPPPAAPMTAAEHLKSSPSSAVNHHPTIYRRRRVVRRPSVYRTKLIAPPSPSSALLVRSRTQPGEPLKHPQILLHQQQSQHQRPVVKRRNSF